MAKQTKIRGITIQLNADTSGLTKSLSDVNSKIRDTQAQLKDVDKLLKLDPKNTELLAQKQRLLKDAVGQTKEKLDLLKQAREKANEALARGDENAQKQLDALQREIIDTENDLKGLTKEAKEFDDKGGKHFASAGEKLKKSLKTAAKVGVAALAAVAAAAVAMGKKLIQSVNEVSEYGDSVDKAAQKIGFSAEAYQKWADVLEHSGTSIDTASSAVKKLFKNAQSGNKAFQALGISQKEAASMSREQLFERTVTALQNVADENKRAALATELFGKAGSELGPLLNMSSTETLAMMNRVEELGGVMSGDAVKAAAKYQDALQDMGTALDGMKRRFVSEFIPSLTEIVDGLTDLFSGKGGSEKLEKGLNSFVEKLNDMIPRILTVAGDMITKLGDAIISNLPTLIPAAIRAVVEFVKGLIAALPRVVDAALEIILALVDGIAEALPELIPAIVDVILTIVDKLTEPDTVMKLTEAAIQIIMALAEGIIKALPILIERIPKIIVNIVQAFIKCTPRLVEAGVMLLGKLGEGILSALGALWDVVSGIGQQIADWFMGIVKGAWEWGKDLILNFWEGIKAFISKPIEAIKSLGSKIKSFLGFSEPEQGPLSNFHTYAPDMMKLFAQGISDNASLITDAIGKAFNLAPEIAKTTGQTAGAREYSVARGAAAYGNRTVILQIKDTEIGRVLLPILSAEQTRQGVELSTGGVY